MTLSDRILFIDGEALVLDKPAGLPVDTPRAGGDSVERRLPELACGFRRPPSPMHRLDRDTSGCLLLARNLKGRQRFAKAFENGLVGKSYLAVVGTEIAEEEGMIDLPLAKISTVETGWRMVVDERGKAARTRWRRIAVADSQSLVEFRPETGRTHQLRIHAALGLGAPIVGDPVYGVVVKANHMTGPDAGMLLHASGLTVPREPREPINVTAPAPERFGRWLDFL